MTGYSAVILAGGKSSRMGQKKATLQYRGKSFIEIIIDKLSDVGIDDIMVSGYEYADDRCKLVSDIYLNKGPLAGIHAALQASVNESVLVITEDAPLVSASFIRELMEAHSRNASRITVAECNGRMQQLLGVYDKELAPICEELLGEGRATVKSTVKSLIERVGCEKLTFDGDEIIIRGCNTPEEYNALSNYKEI